MKILIKYVTITVCGVVLFIVINRSACPARSTPSIGSEGFFLILPLLWWIIERTTKDLWSEIKQKSNESAQDSESDNDHGANEKRPRV